MSFTYKDECKNKIIQIPIENWPHLMDMFKVDWPKHFLNFYSIKNYIDWKNLSSSGNDEFKFYSINDNWNDGTHMIIDSNNHVLLNTLSKNYDCVNDLLEFLNESKRSSYLIIIPYELHPKVMSFMNKNNLTDNGGNTAYLYYFSKEIALNFDIRTPKGYKIKPLSEEHANFIHSVWIYKFSGSVEYIRKLIQRNLQLGIFDENDLPVAWCLRVEYGLLGTLQVVENHKRKGLGSLIVKALAKLCAERGYDSGASMDLINFSSQSLFEKLGFKKIGKIRYVMFNKTQ